MHGLFFFAKFTGYIMEESTIYSRRIIMFKVLDFLSCFFRNVADMLWIDVVEYFKETKEECGIALTILGTIVCAIVALVALCVVLIVILASPIWILILYILKLFGVSTIDDLKRDGPKWLNEMIDEFKKYGLM